MTNASFRIARLTLAVLVFLFAFPAIVDAQVTTARLDGVIKDSSGAIIPGVTVVAKNDATGIPYEALSSDMGIFVLPQLPPGTYTVSSELPDSSVGLFKT